MARRRSSIKVQGARQCLWRPIHQDWLRHMWIQAKCYLDTLPAESAQRSACLTAAALQDSQTLVKMQRNAADGIESYVTRVPLAWKAVAATGAHVQLQV